MAEQICKNCKSFQAFVEGKGQELSGWGEGNVVRAETEQALRHCGKCSNSKLKYGGEEDCPKDGLSYMDCEEYKASMTVGVNFGCVHWEVNW